MTQATTALDPELPSSWAGASLTRLPDASNSCKPAAEAGEEEVDDEEAGVLLVAWEEA